MDSPRVRVAVWKADILRAQRRKSKRISLVVGSSALALLVIIGLGVQHGWGLILDWALIAIPTVVGFAAWVIPVKDAQAKHKWMLFVGGLTFSGLIYFQQYLTRRTHAAEVANLPTKADIARLPTAEDVARLLAELQDQGKNLDELRRKFANLPEHSLPRRAVQLGREIATFLEQRERSRPPFQPSEKDSPTLRRQETEFWRYRAETFHLFTTNFGPRCRGITREFADRGIESSILNKACQLPATGDWTALTELPKELVRIVKELR